MWAISVICLLNFPLLAKLICLNALKLYFLHFLWLSEVCYSKYEENYHFPLQISQKAFKHISLKADTSYGRIKQAFYGIQTLKEWYSIKHIHVPQPYHTRQINKCMSMWLCMTYITASLHLYINACSWYSNNLKP